MTRNPSHRQLVHIQNWLSGSIALRNRLRQHLTSPASPNPSHSLFQEVLVEWDDSPC